MYLIIGLGNPGGKYANTRHNVGFRAVDEFAKKNNLPDFRLVKKFNTEISEGILGQEKIILAKPQIFMNDSGKSVKSLILSNTPMVELISIYKNLWVIHDDIDLPLGKIKIVKNRGAAGHKGVESIIKELGTKNFVRFRVGINPNLKCRNQKSKLQFKIQNVEKFVLQKFTKDEEKVAKEAIEKTIEAIEMVIKDSLEKAMSSFNK